MEVYCGRTAPGRRRLGDAKPQHILVGSRNDIWIIDFGGAYTDGWVEKEKAETMEGDRQGVARIRAFLEGFRVQALRRPKDCVQDEVKIVNVVQG